MLECRRNERQRSAESGDEGAAGAGRGQAERGEIAAAFGHAGHQSLAGDAFAADAALVIGEEEGAVAHDGPAERCAELIALEFGVGLIGRGEVIARVEGGIAEKPVSGAVPIIRAAAGDDVELAGGITAEGGVVGVGKDFEFANGVNGRDHADAVEHRAAVVNAIEGEEIGVFAAAIHIEREIAADGAGGALRRRSDAGDEQAEFDPVAAIEGQAGDLAIIDHGAKRSGSGLDDFGRGGDYHRAGGGAADLQAEIVLPVLVHLQRDGMRELGKAGMLDFDAVLAGGHGGEGETAFGAGSGGTGGAGVLADEGDFGAGDDCAGLIFNHTADGAADGLRGGGGGGHDHEGHGQNCG